MTKGKSDKPAILDGRRNGQGQATRKINKANKSFDEKMKKADTKMKKILK